MCLKDGHIFELKDLIGLKHCLVCDVCEEMDEL